MSYQFLTDAFARLGINPSAGFDPRQMLTNTTGALNDIVNNPSGSARLDRTRAQGVVDIETARQRGGGAQRPITGLGNQIPRNPPAIPGTPPVRPGTVPKLNTPAYSPFNYNNIDYGLRRGLRQGGIKGFLNWPDPYGFKNVPRSPAPVPGTTQPMGLMGKLGRGFGILSALSTGSELGNIAGPAAANYLIQNHPGTAKKIQDGLLQVPGLRDYRDSVRAQNQAGYPLGTETFNQVGYPLGTQIFNQALNQNTAVDPVVPTADPVVPTAPVLTTETPNILQSQAPVVVTTPQIPGQAIGNMAGTDLYNVARQAAAQQGTQQDLDAVTNLGLAQWRANFPGLAGSPLSPEALQRDVQQEELAIRSQDFMEKYKKLMEANKK